MMKDGVWRMLGLWESVFGAMLHLRCFQLVVTISRLKHSNKKNGKERRMVAFLLCWPAVLKGHPGGRFHSIMDGPEINKGDVHVAHQQREPFYQS